MNIESQKSSLSSIHSLVSPYDGLASLIDKAARLVDQRAVAARLEDLNREVVSASSSADSSADALKVFSLAWLRAGLDGTPLRLAQPSPADLPFVVFSHELGWVSVLSQGVDGCWQGVSTQDANVSLPNLQEDICIILPRRLQQPKLKRSALRLVRDAMWEDRSVYFDSVLATGMVTLLALATSLYAMQVFDRVIPNQGFSTLSVLTVGVALSILLELVLKQLRSHIVDRSCHGIDSQLSEWFFQRMLNIRMEARPPSVGTLASQVKGFEMVRGVLASTSLFVLADVPFSLLFLVVIALVGGWVVLVPLVAMPLALLLGLSFQRAIQRHTRLNLTASNRKAGLLVEAVDGAEALKAISAEWPIQARWNRLVAEASAADQKTRHYASLSQNLTVAFQQLGYIALVATGAYFVTKNELTMGGLLACSIIGNRAMAPIVQLPGVMVQWALARASLDGLDQIIALPNEDDDANGTLMPQMLEGGFRFERTQYVYGTNKQVAMELDWLEIKPGERVGLIGPIGSGKSTFLKLASGLYRPAAGKVFLGGVDMTMLAPMVVREIVGYLPQEPRLFSGTLRENLLLGLRDPGDEAILVAARRTGLIDLIASQPAGLALELTEGGRGVSGGQKQLIALTRMLLARPRVWLLDEPTGAMDSMTEARIVSLLRELAREGVTLIVTTHKTALLPLLDRLIVMQGGRSQLDGPRDAVLMKIAGKPQAQEVAA